MQRSRTRVGLPLLMQKAIRRNPRICVREIPGNGCLRPVKRDIAATCENLAAVNEIARVVIRRDADIGMAPMPGEENGTADDPVLDHHVFGRSSSSIGDASTIHSLNFATIRS